MTKRVECSVEGCTRKGRSAGHFICSAHWVRASAETRRKFKHAQKVARRSPLPINVAVASKLWRQAIKEIEADAV